MKQLHKWKTPLLALAIVLAFGSVASFAAQQRPALGETRAFCNVEGCAHTSEARCPAYAGATYSYRASSLTHGNDYYYAQLKNENTKRALDAIDACFNPQGKDIPTPRLGIIEVYGLPAGLSEDDLEEIHRQVVDILCIERPEYFWLDKNNQRFGIQSGTKSSTLVMDFSDRILNPYLTMSMAAQEGETANALADKALARLDGKNGDVERLRALHDFVLEQSEFTYEIEQAYSFTGVLVHGRALCEGYAKTFQLLARRAGYECELVVGDGVRPDGTLEAHMWNAVKVNGGWYLVDCTWDDSESLSRGDKYRYFLLSAPEAANLADHREDGNINLKTLPDKRTPRPEVQVFRFPVLAGAPLQK